MPRPKGSSKGKVVRGPAFAKINLCLHVLGKRPDDYHELRTIFQTISLHDTTLAVALTHDGVIKLLDKETGDAKGEIKFAFAQLAEADVPAAVVSRYGQEFVHWCFVSNSQAR